jgi:SAM-dependent methyltransferase
MKLRDLERNWDGLAERDPLWAVLTQEDKRGGRWDEDEFFATGREEARNVVTRLRELRPDLPAGAALDFGCGVGRVTLALADHFERVVGVDIAAGMIERARAYARTRGCASCSFVHNAHPDLAPFPGETFDLVYSNIVLQHMEPSDALAYVAEFLRVVAPHGLVLFQLPEPPPPTRLRARLRRRSPAFVRRRYDALALRRLYGRGPVMEMHGVPRADVVAAIERHGGAVIDVRYEGDLVGGYANLRYCAGRR